jgi:hypothetical protein
MSLGFVTADELAAAMIDAGKRIAVSTVRYHCRDRRGMLWGHAQFVGRVWMIPADAASEFAAEWTPYGSLRRP